MVAIAQTRVWNGPSRRRVPRFQVRAPLDVTVLRSGIPDTVPGRSLNLCERGIAAVFAGELLPGEAVGVELTLPLAQDSFRTRAVVRYQNRLRCGLEFVGLSSDQQSAIRDWVKEARAEVVTEVAAGSGVATRVVGDRMAVEKIADDKRGYDSGGFNGGSGGSGRPKKKRRNWMAWLAGFLVLVAIGAGVFWWRWNQGWAELESGSKNEATAATKPQAQVPAEVMQKLLVHRVEPVYPAQARQARLEGIIALDIIVGRDGSVISMKALNGPDVLARAAMDALRWWKFEPYRVNGDPAVVETTVAVEFKR
jgi:TonB family protein